MNLDLIKKENEPKVGVQVRIYQSTKEQIDMLASREGVKPSWIIRHALNKALTEMIAEETVTQHNQPKEG